MKILILYGTRRGTTTQTCGLIAKVLHENFGCESEVLKVYKYGKVKKHLTEYDAIIVGSSIQSGQWVSKARRVLKSMRKVQKPLFVFVTAGGTMYKVQKYGITKEEAIQEGIEKYIDVYLEKYKIKPMLKAVFGGRKMKKGVLHYESWNAEDIVNWANEIGTLLKKQ